jgi:ADP-ribosylglycohydrolase
MKMPLPTNYVERVYAGVLGKIIGVYLGRPFEGWSYERIMAELGEINYYVHEKLNVPLIVTDDDISGTFTFLRALADYGNSKDLTPQQIGESWLNYIIERDTILWWGGMGNSTEHTAYLRLKSGIPAPQSGSIALNGKVVAEQIGSQIFIDGWAMVAPGNPELAVDLAKRASSVSHDGEAIYGAQVIAAMESLAFVENDLNKLIDCAISFIPKDSVIYKMIEDIRGWHGGQTNNGEKDWRKARELLAQHYGYDKYGGNCHMVPNHGLIILSLLYGDDDFQKSLMIVNTSGWDTDCNSGNVGCLLGIKNGLAGIESGPDFRTPVADKLYLPTADGGRAITDAVTETYHVVNMGRALAGEKPITPKNGARFHFDLPGSVQGFEAEDTVETKGTLRLENISQQLALHYQGLATGRVARASTLTFIPSEDVASYFERRGYKLLASPTLYTGQTVHAYVRADEHNVEPVLCQLYIRPYVENDALGIIHSDAVMLEPGQTQTLEWTIPDTASSPIASVGLELSGTQGAKGTVYLDHLTWSGAPTVTFTRPKHKGMMWKRAWVNGLDHFDRLELLDFWPEPFRLIQNVGRGLISQGTVGWQDYQATARMTPHLCKTGGIAVHTQGLRRYYALLCDQQKTKIVKVLGNETVLAETNGDWEVGKPYELSLTVEGNKLVASVNGKVVLETTDPDNSFVGGGVGLVCEEGRIGCDWVTIKSLGYEVR